MTAEHTCDNKAEVISVERRKKGGVQNYTIVINALQRNNLT